ncbi:MAG: hypothetical protein V2B20_07335 [Pseudomonadota bacterium]
MQITGSGSLTTFNNVFLLKTANEQPELAGQLISRTVEGMRANETAQSPAQGIDISQSSGPGLLINITA